MEKDEADEERAVILVLPVSAHPPPSLPTTTTTTRPLPPPPPLPPLPPVPQPSQQQQQPLPWLRRVLIPWVAKHAAYLIALALLLLFSLGLTLALVFFARDPVSHRMRSVGGAVTGVLLAGVAVLFLLLYVLTRPQEELASWAPWKGGRKEEAVEDEETTAAL